MMPSSTQVALILGSDERIGIASAQQLARQGAQLALHCDSSEGYDKIRQLRIQLLSVYSRIRITMHAIDLSSAAAAEQLILDVEREHRKVDIVVNTAGTAIRRPNTTQSEADYSKLLAYAVFVDEQRRRYVDLYRISLQAECYSA